jgi:hypothetical protein
LRFNFHTKGIEILPARIAHLKTQAQEMLKLWPVLTYRDLASFVGRIVSMLPVFGGLAQIRTKMCQTFVNIRNYRNLDWDTVISSDYGPLYVEAYAEIIFWNDHVDIANFRSFEHSLVEWTVWTDASQHSIAGMAVHHADPLVTGPITADNLLIDPDSGKFITDYYKRLSLDVPPWRDTTNYVHRDEADLRLETTTDIKIARRRLTESECKKDSNERELLAIQYTLHALLPYIKYNTVHLHTDSLNASTIVTAGSNKPRLQFYAKQISDYCIANKILLTATWLPRGLNQLTDAYTRVFDQHSFAVTTEFYNTVLHDFRIVPNLDVFANEINTKTERFYSITHCPHTLGVDSFLYNWSPPNVCWIFPPPKLVLAAILKLERDGGVGLLLIPQWKNASFYPYIRKLYAKHRFQHIAYDGARIFLQGDDPTSFFDENFKGNVEVWSLNFASV